MAAINIDQAFEMALQLYGVGNVVEAEVLCRRMLERQPDNVDALHLLGVIARVAGRSDASVELIGRAISLRPNWPEADINLAAALLDLGRVDEAIACCRQAIAGVPQDAQAHNNLAAALQRKGLLDEAIEAYKKAILLCGDVAEMHCNLGTALEEKGDVDDAIAAYQRAIALKPDYAEAHNNHAMLTILKGDVVAGWREYEWRLRCRDYPRPRWNISGTRWDGSALNGRRIFLYTEQGLGDAIQFVRYTALVAANSGRIVLGCAPELRRLFESVDQVEHVVVWGEDVPPFDVYCPLMSLAMVFGHDLEQMAKAVPYLAGDVESVERWKALVGGEGERLKVGIAWAGGVRPVGRSISVEELSPLLQVKDVDFYSLQKGSLAKPVTGLSLIDHMDFVSDFADTAALIANLDLVISVDTSVAHLAGAMGKPVWNLLKFMPDCRWMLGREDTPWYPTMRLFRQSRIGDWDGVIQQVAEELCKKPRTK